PHFRLDHCVLLFSFNDTPTTEIYTLSPTRRSSDLRVNDVEQALVGAHFELLAALLVDVRPTVHRELLDPRRQRDRPAHLRARALDRKSTRLNSSHVKISYAVFCLKKKKNRIQSPQN